MIYERVLHGRGLTRNVRGLTPAVRPDPRACGPDPCLLAGAARYNSRVPLDPVARKLLDEVAASGRPNAHLLPVTEARANFESLFAGLGPGEPVAAVADHSIPVDGAAIPARSYRPAGCRAGETVRSSSTSTAAAGCSARSNPTTRLPFARKRLGRGRPQRRLPPGTRGALPGRGRRCARRDALGARQRRAAGRRPGRLAVAGDSAGGNLAAVVCQDLRDAGRADRALPAARLSGHDGRFTNGFDMAYEGYFLYRDEMLWHQEHYLSSPADARTLASRPCSATRPACRRPPSRRPSATRCTRRPSATGTCLPAAGVPVEFRSTPA